MRERNNEKLSSLTMAKGALNEWDELAKDKRMRNTDLLHLREWDNEIYVEASNTFLDYDKFQQKRKRP